MRKSARFAVCLVVCAFAAGNLVVTVAAAAPGKATTASARVGQAKQALAPIAGQSRTRNRTLQPVAVDVSKLPRLSTVPQGTTQLPLLVKDAGAYAAGKKHPLATPGKAIIQPTSPTGSAHTAQTSSATLVHNFTGMTSAVEDSTLMFSSPYEPPDTQIGVGGTRVVEMTNAIVSIYDKSGTVIDPGTPADNWFLINSGPPTLPGGWAGFFFGGEHLTPTDPRVVYDASNGHFYATIVAFNPTSFDSVTVLGITQTGDPNASWNIYPIDVEGGQFGPAMLCDQPKLGFSSDKFVASCNLFLSNSTFNGDMVMVTNKAQGVSGSQMVEQEFQGSSTGPFSLVPAVNLNAGIATAYLASNLSNGGSSPSTAATQPATVTGLPTSFSGNGCCAVLNMLATIPMSLTGFPPAAPQQPSTNLSQTTPNIDTGDDRFLSAFVQGGVFYTSAAESCTPAGDSAARSCVRLVELNVTTNSLIDSETAGQVGNYLINPTLSVNSSGDVVFEYSASSATSYPDVETAIEPVADANTIVGGGQVVAGTGPYIGTTTMSQTNARWGDYGEVVVDPSAPAYVYLAGEFSNGPTDGSAGVQWATRIAEIYGRIPAVCTAQSFISDVASPQKPSATVNLTATATCLSPATPVYQFWIKPPSGVLTMVQDYSATNTYSWTNHVTLGTYTLEVLVKASTETAKNFDSFLAMSYTISATPCTTPTLAASPSSFPQVAGTPVTLTASTTCADTTPLYQFWVRTPDLVFHMILDYSPSNMANWTTFDTQVGSYLLEVLVKNTGSLSAFESFASIPYAMQLCNTPTMTTSASSSQPSGAVPITLTANANCLGGAQYAFYYRDPGGLFHLIQGYSATNTATWNADYQAGTYQLLVEVRPTGSSAAFVTFLFTPFTLTGCGLPGLTSDLSSPQVAGTTVTFTASATCTGTADFKFWVQSPSGVWTMVQDYGNGNTFVWHSPTTAGTYTIEVWDRNAGALEDPFDNFLAVKYTLGLCSAPTMTTSAPSPQPSGTGPITLTANATCVGGAQYEFWYEDTSFHLIQGYSATNTATWKADYQAGTYQLLVEVRPTGSSAAFVTFLFTPFTLTGCTNPTLSSDKASPQAHGTTITFTAGATCSGTADFQFWVRDPLGVWHLAQPYGSGNTFAWTPTTVGTYLVEVWARNVGANDDSFDTFTFVTYNIT